ncbi:hypothetical protein GCM10010869_21580 [Mesorhizobium tianshanense]|uniref:Uncharacterized protein n=1 Tax=Mesorhizobium tianshanense TaxID=39844 RepID=A0A562MGY6_9HYPH|nr:hypothetical protein [Mesorhizobium tianshanense]TWI19164.1 hypothetical protein IQ26_07170 [Mesorhizobium tianshanense]GLS36569.1 hypothetical protein GCM10010869_21580 [Mesorhizobium tianshanense]
MTGNVVTQRDYMRKLAVELGGDKSKVCAAYVQAEIDGIVLRKRNADDTRPEDYATALWADGVRKGWLPLEDGPATDRMKSLSVAELLVLHAQIGEELRDRGVVRSANNPTGDLAKYLFCRAFGWRQAPNSERGYDAIGTDGTRYQIKGRRIHRRNKSRQLSAIRDIEGGHFDVLAGVLFDDDFNVVKAALIPIAFVVERSTYIAHTNSNKFMLRDDVWTTPGVRDVTAEIVAAMP